MGSAARAELRNSVACVVQPAAKLTVVSRGHCSHSRITQQCGLCGAASVGLRIGAV